MKSFLDDAGAAGIEIHTDTAYLGVSGNDVKTSRGMFSAGYIINAAGLYAEFNSPGLIVPGVIGVVCIVLAAFAFQILPFSWAGLALMLLGMGLFVVEIYVPMFGAFFILGAICLLLGGTMIFDRPDLSDVTISFWKVLLPAVTGIALFAGLVVFAVGRTLFVAQTAGVDDLLGLVGTAASTLSPDGKVFVRGEYWNADADEEIAEGEAVEVAGVKGLRIRVRRANPRA